MKTIFWGSSEISLPFLKLLFEHSYIKLNLVITTPDKPKDRGLKLKPSVVKVFANENKINCLTPSQINNDEFYNTISSFFPDLSVVVSYGKVIPTNIINLHKIGMLNIHFSLLPKYRGAAPIQWALINGERETGVTIFWINDGIDTGEIFLQEKVLIYQEDDYYSLSERLINVGCKLLNYAIKNIIDGKITKINQSGETTYAPLIKKEQGRINWYEAAEKIHNKVRAFVHWPKAYTTLKVSTTNKIIEVKILKTQLVSSNEFIGSYKNFEPGNITKINKNYLVVKCGKETFLKILKIQPENKKELLVKDFICGYRVKEFDKFI